MASTRCNTSSAYLALALAFCLLLLTGCPGSSGGKIVGKWAGTGSIHDAGTYEFRGDNRFVVSPPNGAPETGAYSVDLTKTPAWIDFIPANSTQRMEGIVAFHSDDEFEMVVAFPGDARPVSFRQERHYLLRRLAN